MADHLSRLTYQQSDQLENPIHDSFPDEQLMHIESQPISPTSLWYADIANYLVTKRIPNHWFKLDKQKFFRRVVTFFWDDPYLFKYCLDQIIRRCIPDHEQQSVINFCHNLACGGHFSVKKTVVKILQSGF